MNFDTRNPNGTALATELMIASDYVSLKDSNDKCKNIRATAKNNVEQAKALLGKRFS